MNRLEQALELIKESGKDGFTSAALALEMDIKENHARVICSTLHKRKQIFIADHRRTEDETRRMYPRPVYRFGSRHDVPRPPCLTNAEYQRRWRGAIRLQASSVFDLGKPINGRKLIANVSPSHSVGHSECLVSFVE